MGISVYAPGSEIVADGHLLRSGAVWFNSKEPDVRFYTRCPQCRKISIYLETQQPANICDRCGTAVVRPPKRYIKPDAFSTLAEDNVQEPGLYRRRPPRNSDVFLLEGAEDFADHLTIPGVSFGIRRNGKMSPGFSRRSSCQACHRTRDDYPAGYPEPIQCGLRCGRVAVGYCGVTFSRTCLSPTMPWLIVRVKNGSKMCERFSGGMPGPLSTISTTV